jgi:hypothetical protein
MTGVIEILVPGVSGPQHLLIPESRPRRQSYTIPTDVSLTLPPLTMNALAGYGMKATSNDQSMTSSGMPSPPSSDCSQSHTAPKQSPMSQESTSFLQPRRHTPPYSGTEPWIPRVPYTTAPSQDMPEQTAYDMSFGTLAVRPASQRQFQQYHSYSTPTYGSPVIPAPSSLLGARIAQAPNYLPSRALPMYQSLPPLIPSGAHDYASIPYGHHFHSSTGNTFVPAPGYLTWQPSAYPPSSIQSQTWAQQPRFCRPSRPTTILGSLPREAWQRVFQYLDYANRLRLQRVNRFWAESLKALDKRIKENPSDADFADMHSLVVEAENYRKHWSPSVATQSKTPRGRPRNNARNIRKRSEASDDADDSSNGRKDAGAAALIGNVGCYHCFTVRPPENFAMKIEEEDENAHEDSEDADHASIRPRSGPAPRRYCLECGIKKGYYPPGKYLETKIGNNHIIWICCEGYHEYGLRNCPTCGRGCPLTPVNKTSRNSRKRSSPMPPPPSPPQRRQQTSEVMPTESGHTGGYDQGYHYAQTAQGWS